MMQELRTWTVENAAGAITNQDEVATEFRDTLAQRMRSAIADGDLSANEGRVTPDAVNEWLEAILSPVRWVVDPALKFRDRVAEGEFRK